MTISFKKLWIATVAVFGLGVFSSNAALASGCERNLAPTVANTYGPNRNNLVISKSADGDNSSTWTLGYQILDQVFDLAIAGVQDVSIAQNNLVATISGRHVTIGSLATKTDVAYGDLAFPVTVRKVVMNENVLTEFSDSDYSQPSITLKVNSN